MRNVVVDKAASASSRSLNSANEKPIKLRLITRSEG
jgi:hypothetical protein